MYDIRDKNCMPKYRFKLTFLPRFPQGFPLCNIQFPIQGVDCFYRIKLKGLQGDFKGFFIWFHQRVKSFISFSLYDVNCLNLLKNPPSWMKKILKFTLFMCLKSSTMVGKSLKFTLLKWLKMQLKSSTMVGENFEIYPSEMAKNALKSHFK